MPDCYDHNLLIRSLRNLRPEFASLLGKIRNGILNKKGIRAVIGYRRAMPVAPRNVILNRLRALQGELMDMDPRVLPFKLKSQIRTEISNVKHIS